MTDGIKMTIRKLKNVVRNEARLSRATLITLLGMLAITLQMSVNSTRSPQSRSLENVQESLLTIPSVLSDLLHLYEKLPNATSQNLLPPFREVTYAFRRQKVVSPSLVTLSTQLTVSRLPRLVQLLARWGGPVSCAVHLPDPSAIHIFYDFVQAQTKFVHDLVTFHVMLEKPTPYYDYPINRLRNLALLNIDTEHFFLCDVDFLPQKDALGRLLPFLSTHSMVNEQVKKLYVLPAFEVVGDRYNSMLTSLVEVPQDKTELLSMLQTEKLQPFHTDYNKEGHAPINYDRWYQCPKNESYLIEYQWKFEPYVVGRKYGIPLFDERLRAFGYNKASWIAEAHLLGYQFEVLCDHFVVHVNNPEWKGRDVGNNSPAIDWYQRMYLPLRYNVTIVENRKEVLNSRELVYSVPKRRKKRHRRRRTKQKQ